LVATNASGGKKPIKSSFYHHIQATAAIPTKYGDKRSRFLMGKTKTNKICTFRDAFATK
jgi:hypothetical protein